MKIKQWPQFLRSTNRQKMPTEFYKINIPGLYFLFGQRLDHFLSKVIDCLHLSCFHCNLSDFCSLIRTTSCHILSCHYLNVRMTKHYFLSNSDQIFHQSNNSLISLMIIDWLTKPYLSVNDLLWFTSQTSFRSQNIKAKNTLSLPKNYF